VTREYVSAEEEEQRWRMLPDQFPKSSDKVRQSNRPSYLNRPPDFLDSLP